MKHFFRGHRIAAMSVLLGMLLAGAVSVYAGTTIGTDISTDGNLSVTGVSTLNGAVGIATTTAVYPLTVAGNTRITGTLLNGNSLYSDFDTNVQGWAFDPLNFYGANGKFGFFSGVTGPNAIAVEGLAQSDGTHESNNYGGAFFSDIVNANDDLGTYSDAVWGSAFGEPSVGKTLGSSAGGGLEGIVGFISDTEMDGAGTTQGMTAYYAETPVKNAGTVHRTYGYFAKSFSGVGDTLNAAFYAADQGTGATDYALYSAGGKSYFAGNVGIGTTTPQGKLDVSAGANATTTVTIGELGLTSSKGCVNINTSAGTPMSFYFNAARVMVIEANYCR